MAKKGFKIELWQFARGDADGGSNVDYFNNEAAADRAAEIYLDEGGSLAGEEVSSLTLEFDENGKLINQKYDSYDVNTGESLR